MKERLPKFPPGLPGTALLVVTALLLWKQSKGDVLGFLAAVGVVLLGLWASYVMGASSAKAAAQDVIRPHARSSLRRIVTIAQASVRVIQRVDERQRYLRSVEKGGKVDIYVVESSLEILAAQAAEIYACADDATRDWQDVLPGELESILKELPKREVPNDNA